MGVNLILSIDLCKLMFFILTPIDQYVIDKVREMRTAHGLSQAELADSIGVNKSFIGAVENPKQRAKYNIEHLNRLSIVFNCPFSDFFPEQPFDDDQVINDLPAAK